MLVATAKPKDLIRFLDYVVNADKNGCWIWRGAVLNKKMKHQYGAFAWLGKPRKASRVMFQMLFGDIPDGMHVLHSCDVSLCVNPRHLYLGDHAQNMRDKSDRGRVVSARGEAQHLSKLSEKSVLEIRSRYAAGALQPQLAIEYGVTQSTISAAILRKTWRHVL